MKIVQYLKSFLPSVEKKLVKDDLRAMIVELKTVNLPSYENAVPMFKKVKFVSQFSKSFDADIKNGVSRYRENYIATIRTATKNALETAEWLLDHVDNDFPSILSGSSLDLRKAQAMQLVESISFFSEYSRRLLLMTLSMEADPENALEGRAQIRTHDWLSNHRQAYLIILETMLRKTKEVEDLLGDVPDVLVTEDTAAIAQRTAGIAKTDPFRAGLISTSINPIYHIRMAIADHQITRYKKMQEEKKSLELKLLLLKDKRDGKENPKLEGVIEYTEDRITKLEYKLRKLEVKRD